MQKSVVAISILSIALLASNIWWAVNALDSGVTQAHQSDALLLHQQAVKQLLNVVKANSESSASRDSIIAAASQGIDASEAFEKDGFLWIGAIGLRFDANGRLIQAAPSWSE